ncbi:uncharacterized protein LOC100874828 [Megachile rotundata]|uniref:uncharacterized protein LOC100874828 n=1 Tax=Megachile rotundata TaxID=143995 RepID=UPI003FD59099
MRTLKGSFVGLCLLLIAMAKATPTSPLASASALTDQITNGINTFASSLFQSKVQSLNDNLLLSPLSTAIDLAMVASGSGGDTKSQLKKALNLPSSDSQAIHGYQALIDDLKDIQYSQLIFANKMFIGQDFSIKPTYRNLVETYFRSSAQNLDFHQPADAAETINKWIRDLTEDHPGHIKEIISSSDLDAKTRLLLVNAMYFKGEWKAKFLPENTKQRPFRINEDRNKTVATMYRLGVYKYGNIPGNNGRFIVLPYKGDELCMVIMLPNELSGLTELEEEIKKLDIADILKEGSDSHVQLYLPKFELRSKVSLEDSLRNLGLTDMFESRANFNGIADGNLFISKIIQSTYIELSEEGVDVDVSEGDIITRLQVTAGKPKEFNVNQPFYYALIRNIKGSANNSVVTLYSGQVLEPKLQIYYKMGSSKNCILSVCLVLVALAITQINGQGSLTAEHGVNSLAASLFKPVAEDASGNIWVSPTGAFIALGMLEHGAGGKTKAQFKKVLHLPSSERSGAAGYESLIKNLKDVHANEIKFGSKLFTASNAPIKDSYKKMLKKHFDAETQPLNFNNAAASANAINAWVQSVAKDHPGHLANLIAPSDLGPETKMVLVNPIYFKGYWMNGFNVNNTRQRPFKLNNSKEKNVPTMSKTSLLKYGEMPNGKATYVVLPLRANELSMVVFLPKAVDGLAELEKELPKASISSYINAAQDRMVAVQLPRFHFHNKINLKKPLMSLGLTDAFNQNANFSGISNQKLHVSRIVQNTHVEVDEEGGDIDVGTGDITSRIALPPAVNFDVNHPFHVVIVKNNKSGSNRNSHITLYSGHVMNP